MYRFTDTDKWKDPWFRNLKAPHKLIFLFIVDNCNNAGFYELDEDLMIMQTGLDKRHLEGAWKALQRGIFRADGWIWVRKFLKHQKNGDLNPVNPAHKQIITLLKEQSQRFIFLPEFKEFVGAYKGLLSPIGKGQVKVNKKKGVWGKQELEAAETIYAEYPYKTCKPDAIKAICKAMDRGVPFETLLHKTVQYAKARKGQDPNFTPHPATWFNREQYNDEPSTWLKQDKPIAKKPVDDLPVLP